MPTPQPNDLPFPSSLDETMKPLLEYMPQLEDFGFEKEEIEHSFDERACLKFVGGEDQGFKRLNDYIEKRKSISHYFDTRNELFGSEYSSKLSPWMANGCLSVRQIFYTA